MIYECTDCEHCADFSDGFRVICLHPSLAPNQVCEYVPLGDKYAENCPCFSWDEAHEFTYAQLDEALAYPDESGQINSYGGMRRWVGAQIAESTTGPDCYPDGEPVRRDAAGRIV